VSCPRCCGAGSDIDPPAAIFRSGRRT
jgi:hypothetical protein